MPTIRSKTTLIQGNLKVTRYYCTLRACAWPLKPFRVVRGVALPPFGIIVIPTAPQARSEAARGSSGCLDDPAATGSLVAANQGILSLKRVKFYGHARLCSQEEH